MSLPRPTSDGMPAMNAIVYETPTRLLVGHRHVERRVDLFHALDDRVPLGVGGRAGVAGRVLVLAEV